MYREAGLIVTCVQCIHSLRVFNETLQVVNGQIINSVNITLNNGTLTLVAALPRWQCSKCTPEIPNAQVYRVKKTWMQSLACGDELKKSESERKLLAKRHDASLRCGLAVKCCACTAHLLRYGSTTHARPENYAFTISSLLVWPAYIQR